MRRAAGSAALGIVLLLCAATFAMRSMYIPGITFLALGVGFAIWVTLAAAGAQLEREAGPATVEEGAAWPLRILVKPGIIPPPGGEVIEPLLKQPLRLSKMTVGRDGNRRVRVEVRFGRRGRRLIEPSRLVVGDPLGLAQREIGSATERGEVLVLPRIEPVLPVEGGGAPGTASRGREGGDGGAAAHAPAPDMELDVLRPYRPGAPATRIHWPTLARTGELMERRFVADPRARPLIVVDSHDPEGERELDAAMRAAASLAYQLSRGGGCSVLLPGDRRPALLRPDMHAFAEVHARLALLAPASAVPAVARRTGAGPIVWVTASRLIPSLPARMGAGWIVAPHALAAGAPAEFRVGGCIGQRLAAVWKEAA
ncbi:MAG: hypothetical protein QOC55_547 [Thermoleophilaceae bacterium]|jgi:uncharacterized protein (DUF58 family)|nr:hypothetical protein [Thermoleophilaceae bacterium]